MVSQATTVCPSCGNATPAALRTCAICRAPLPGVPQVAGGVLTPSDADAETPTMLSGPPYGRTSSDAHAGERRVGTGPLCAGQAFGSRYHIIRLLGAGGMGAVYQAWDDELGVAVALKVIRPEVADNPDAVRLQERRFKRELVLARQVTHKHVVRIHDLGEVDGIKYITMPYIQGDDLARTLRREGPLPVARALRLARQVVSGLVAAHEAGVVHRDLKPENIMIDESDHPSIMDFGIARPAPRESGAATTIAETVGGVMGTIEYMAPEQALGQPVDHRADIYAFGLILREMLAGLRRGQAGTSALQELAARIQQAPAPLRPSNPQVTEPLDGLITRCLEPNPAERFQTTAELLAVLERLDDTGHPRPEPVAARVPSWALAVAAALVLLLPGTAWWLARLPSGPPAPKDPVSVLIADFDNRAGDPVFEGALEQALAVGIEGATFVTSYNRQQAKTLAQQLTGSSRLDERAARLVALREGVRVVIVGTIESRGGDGYQVAAKAIDASGNLLYTAGSSASSKAAVLPAMSSVAATLREALGDTEVHDEQAKAETFTARSLESVREYALAQDLASAGKDEEAIAHYRNALAQDPDFGRAYSGWAISAGKIGRVDEAEQAFKKALSLLNRMTEREKWRTLGAYYLQVAKNYEKGIENYSELVKRYPADRAGHSNLAVAYFVAHNLDKAREHARRSIEIYPKNPTFRSNYALLGMYVGDFKSATEEARRVIEIAPALPKPYVALAMAAIDSAKFDEARGAYERMASSGPRGPSLANIGLADLALYQGRYAEAVPILQTGIAQDETSGNTAGLATKRLALAEAHLGLGQTGPAAAQVAAALKLNRDYATRLPAARLLLRMGKKSEVSAIRNALGAEVPAFSRAYARLIEGELALAAGKPAEALDAMMASRKLVDLWLTRFALGVANVEAGAYAEAVSELELCLKRRGEATALFLDEVPTIRYLPPVYYWLARAQEGLNIRASAIENFQKYLALRAEAPNDPLASDARRRMAALTTGSAPLPTSQRQSITNLRQRVDAGLG